MKVVLADVEPGALADSVGKLQAEGLEVSGAQCDVADFDSVLALRDTTIERHGAVHLLCNNAGIGAGAEGAQWEHELNDWRWAINVNVYGVIHGINAFVPTMVAARRRGTRRQHLLGQRRGVATPQDPPVRSDQSSGGDPDRVPVRPAPGRRFEDRGIGPLSRSPHAADRASSARGECDHRSWPRNDRDKPPIRRSRTSRSRCRRQESRSTTPSLQKSPIRWWRGSETVPSGSWHRAASTDAQIQARAASMLNRTNPTYLREVPG